jgi:hypothetical protein
LADITNANPWLKKVADLAQRNILNFIICPHEVGFLPPRLVIETYTSAQIRHSSLLQLLSAEFAEVQDDDI